MWCKFAMSDTNGTNAVSPTTTTRTTGHHSNQTDDGISTSPSMATGMYGLM